MSRTAAPTPIRTQAIKLEADWLHPGQREVYDSQARFKIVCCGRQWGKTSLAALMCVEEAAVEGGTAWWVSPHYKEGELAWTILRYLCRPIPGVKFQGRPIWRADFPSGGVVQVHSADDPNSLRGSTLSGLVIDEAAQVKEEAWDVLRPALAVRQGWATFISTPHGLNWFYDLFTAAEQHENWERWRFPSTMNPRFSPETWEQERAEMHPLIFSQEYEAEFVQAAGTIFRREWFRYYYRQEDAYILVGAPDTERVPIDSCTRFATVDLAFSVEERADYTVISSWAVTPKRQLILLDVDRGHMEASGILDALQSAFGKHRLGYLAIERAAKQRGVIRDAERSGLPIREVAPDANKLSRAMPAAARMERSQIFFPSGEAWMKPLEEEMLAFPAGRHDDFVDTLAYAALRVAGTPSGSGPGIVVL